MGHKRKYPYTSVSSPILKMKSVSNFPLKLVIIGLPYENRTRTSAGGNGAIVVVELRVVVAGHSYTGHEQPFRQPG